MMWEEEEATGNSQKKQNIPKETQISIIFQLLLIVLWYNMGDGYTLKSSLYFVMKLKF